MVEKSCRCGVSKKNFKLDIGPFYISECCERAGFDHTGKQKGEQSQAPSEPKSTEVPSEPKVESSPSSAPSEQKLGKGKLKDMRVDDLKALAQQRGISGCQEMNKKQLVEAILANQG